jgi:luciferase family oxidoreductase group 1
MLSHYSALKVAEQFRMLETLFPGRIDLGIGRAPGSDQLTAAALSHPRPEADIRYFPNMVVDLLGFLYGTTDPDHPFAKIHVQPGPHDQSGPEVWLLGSSDYSAQLAAMLGLPFAFAAFFGRTAAVGPPVAELYRKEFRQTVFGQEPRLNVTVHVMCAPTEEEAKYLAASRRFQRAARMLGVRGGMLPPDEALNYPLPPEAKAHMDEPETGGVDGTPEQVRDGVLRIAETYQTADVGIVTNCYSFADRVRSYELVAQAFGLEPRTALRDRGSSAAAEVPSPLAGEG